MTIEEAIAKLKSDADIDKYNMRGYSMEQHKQIAEWLEKLQYIENIILKWNADFYNDEDNGIPDNEILEAIFNACTDNGFDIQIDEDYRNGYNNAIDEFVTKLEEHLDNLLYPQKYIKVFIYIAHTVAEHLKAGK